MCFSFFANVWFLGFLFLIVRRPFVLSNKGKFQVNEKIQGKCCYQWSKGNQTNEPEPRSVMKHLRVKHILFRIPNISHLKSWLITDVEILYLIKVLIF